MVSGVKLVYFDNKKKFIKYKFIRNDQKTNKQRIRNGNILSLSNHYLHTCFT